MPLPLFLLSPTTPWPAATIIIAGFAFFTPLVNAPVIGILTVRTPAELRPKVMTAVMTVATMAGPFGFIAAGYLLRHVSLGSFFIGLPALLTLGSLTICVVVGLAVGIVSGTRQYSWFDRISMSLTLILANTPAFWLGLVLMVVLALYLGWFPATGMYSMRAAQKTVGDLLHHMVLPAITTAAVSAAIIARLVRSSFLDVVRKHYMTALRAKGLAERDIILRHGMKNALPPIINIVGLQVGYLMGGALFTEVVFSWPGIGLQIYSSIVARDLPVVQAAVLVTTFVFVLVNLGTDIVVAALDPRIRRA